MNEISSTETKNPTELWYVIVLTKGEFKSGSEKGKKYRLNGIMGVSLDLFENQSQIAEEWKSKIEEHYNANKESYPLLKDFYVSVLTNRNELNCNPLDFDNFLSKLNQQQSEWEEEFEKDNADVV